MWISTINQEAFLGLIIYYVDSDWNLCNFLLDIVLFAIKHSGVNIAQEIMHILGEFNISNRILALMTDNDFAMLSCGNEITAAFNDNIFLDRKSTRLNS